MCGIVGFQAETFNDKHLDTLIALMEQSKIRGLHAFGMAYLDRWAKPQVFKSHRLRDLFEVLDEQRPTTLIFHNRYSTSGDFADHANNQPVVWNASALVFNGVLSMKTKPEMEAEYGLKMDCENDGELFLRHLDDPMGFLRKSRGTFAGMWLTGGIVRFLRNQMRPAYGLKTNDATFVASTADIMVRAGLPRTNRPLPPYQILTLDEIQ